MDQSFIEKMKQDLLKEQANLRKQLESFAEPNENVPDDYNTKYIDIGTSDEENATEVEQYSNQLSVEKGLESSLAEVDEALERIEKGTYGKCDKCGKEIPEQRLEAHPAAKVCVNCSD